MIVVAGPPGSGKSTLYPVSSFGIAYFNADDRAAEINSGSYAGISGGIRKLVNRELEAFILGSIERRVSFAIETTLRVDATFEQVRLAKRAGFVVEMRYLGLRDFGTQGERCFIGRRLKSQLRVTMNERWDIDHDKGSPPTIRGILCSTCNRWLGYLERSHTGQLVEMLERAAEYVHTPPARKAGVNRRVTFDPTDRALN